ncbi:MAG: tail fiber protein [Bacteroidia bacterium]|nr:tail fiber protein [Bacteroidia bacterium]MBT8275851.1 tail fiber protein [Bacteroidia bacterium]NNF31225.1 phage tail protein [Flavobacteriaceae bacterium]NNJ81954.1 phage tail protein [Flavobacteriaceae bacterium]NNM09924.1 phage tail protein [Flavobacteriaceae bacterium]
MFISLGSFAQEGFIGEIKLFAGNFAPRGWAFCDGQLLAISGNSALFSILGTTYGGDGRTTFGLPDLRGRVPVGPRNGQGMTDVRLGQKFGPYENKKPDGSSESPASARKVKQGTLGLNYIICLIGVYPSRN